MDRLKGDGQPVRGSVLVQSVEASKDRSEVTPKPMAFVFRFTLDGKRLCRLISNRCGQRRAPIRTGFKSQVTTAWVSSRLGRNDHGRLSHAGWSVDAAAGQPTLAQMFNACICRTQPAKDSSPAGCPAATSTEVSLTNRQAQFDCYQIRPDMLGTHPVIVATKPRAES
ncbi:uncharacterized protein PGTG_18960 [Puccinia graminis f. sp. tritici CRL 75-36-700-3]|uniref:Uncharacterized protein n=1 Tax=Puccinia graminis f. sp. tritici (strain CRL 75-36-700-3 / race SCCL) TaxID=418459 RepID=E3L8S2_PUCGT|nr:uncharacterized protein PGTG_18960 [Puccinia graminis f. sp. tritici CRL 75-36-700-3]EFP92947.1 hypothetical protein PGTG_18960 [Puccinia graminis f. sp. tritici CRL 75-36-700-3]